MNKFTEIIWSSISSIIAQISSFLPNFIAGLIILLIGWILAKSVANIIHKILERPIIKGKIESLIEAIGGVSWGISFTKVIAGILYWFIFLIFLLSATEAMKLSMLSQEISRLIQYLPQLISALIVLVIGLYIAAGVRDIVSNTAKSLGVKLWRVLGGAAFYFLAIMMTITALNQAGIDTLIITSNLTVIVGSFALAFSIAYGLAARNLLAGILTSFHSKDYFHVGQVIEVDNFKGEIIAMDTVTVTLDTGESKIIIPVQRLLADKVVILKDDLSDE